MRENGTDRDVALELVTALDTCKTLVESINDKLYSPHITTQPTEFEGEIGDTAVFTVVATNVKSYQWQYTTAGVSWTDSGASGNKTASLSIGISETRLNQTYRCKITGLDDTIIYTDGVKMVLPEANG